MALPERIRLEDFPHSPYARELAAGVSRLRFAQRLERIYRSVHLSRMRTRIRLWFTLMGVIALMDLGFRLGTRIGFQTAARAGAVADFTALILAPLAWSRYYARFYLPLARLLVPIFATAVAVDVALSATDQGERFAVLPISILVIFFFTGLLYRAAMAASIMLFASFVVTCIVVGVPHQVLIPGICLTMLTLLLCIVGYRDVEYFHRRTFLETALISELVSRDGLSGLTNRLAFDEHLQALWNRAQREQRPLAILMLDIDHFKAYNDTHGHQAGDTVLREVARLLNEVARRPLDMAGRYGGDEFIAVLYDLPQQNIADIAERLRQSVQRGLAASVSSSDIRITVSIGAGVMTPGADRSAHGGVQLADEALYEAKLNGRNRVVIKGMEEYERLETGSFRAATAVPAA
jgi:diguanylate cyclase (GGDEF)-like protein